MLGTVDAGAEGRLTMEGAPWWTRCLPDNRPLPCNCKSVSNIPVTATHLAAPRRACDDVDPGELLVDALTDGTLGVPGRLFRNQATVSGTAEGDCPEGKTGKLWPLSRWLGRC